ncbi:MAG: NYN domain-containing protein [Longimicrobiaceae bacterium]
MTQQHHQRPKRIPRQERSGKALVDGSNVAHSSEGEKARLRNIELVVARLEEEGLEPIVVADAALRHQIDEAQKYEQLIDDGEIRQAPAGTDADWFILSFARELDAYIVSNDRFRDRQEAFPDARERMIRYMILEDEVVFEKRNRRRSKG